MKNIAGRSLKIFFLAALTLAIILPSSTRAQEKVRLSYSSTDALNGIWTVAQDKGFYKGNGLDADLVYIESSTVGAAAIVAGDIQVGNVAGSAVANGDIRGGDLVCVACFINRLAYELVVQANIKTPADLRGKTIGISRFGSVSDVAARELLRGIGLQPDKDVEILQVGGASERAAGFSRGIIAGFPSPPGNVDLIPGGLPHRILASMADFQKPFPLPFICAVTKKGYLAKNRETVKKTIMALIEATHYFKTNKEGTQKVIGKYLQGANEAYLEDSYRATAKILDRVPYPTRAGMKIQLEEALKNSPGSKITVDDLIDGSLVRELQQEGFIDRVYGSKG